MSPPSGVSTPATPAHGRIEVPDYAAPWWLRSAHGQTLWPNLFRPQPRPRLRRHRLELADGDFVDLDIAKGDPRRTVLLLHGLEGSSSSPYIRGMVQAISQRGWRAVVMHFRGCSGEPNRLARTYHSGDTGDVSEVIGYLKSSQPDGMLALVGYSLGGNVLLKLLGEQTHTLAIDAGVAVSVPFVLSECARRLEHGGSRLYQWWLIRSLQRTLARKPRTVDSPIDLDSVNRHRTFTSFDHHITAPLHDFASGDDYYRRASSRQFLRHIVTPTLVIQARDDPFMTPEVLPQAHELSPAVCLELSETGGHVGFVHGCWPWSPRYWLEQRVPAFLEHYLG